MVQVNLSDKEFKLWDVYQKLPLTFIENVGQINDKVKYYSKGRGFWIYFSEKEASISFRKQLNNERQEETNSQLSVSLRFIDANPDVTINGYLTNLGKVNFFRGNDPNKWYSNISTYEGVIYQELWQGIDLSFYTINNKLKYEFKIKPDARIEDIHLTYSDAQKLILDNEGNLLVHSFLGVLKDEKPVSYQEIGGEKISVSCSFVVNKVNEEWVYGFELGQEYNSAYDLIIDPGLDYSTYIGAERQDEGHAIAIDAAGNAYITGWTDSTIPSPFPTTSGAFDTTYNGGSWDAFVTKISADGSSLIYSTFLGGGGTDQGYGIAVDAAGNAYITGQTSSTTPNPFPTTSGAFQTSIGGFYDAFVTKLSADGSSLIYSSYLGGGHNDGGIGIAVDSSGNAYIAGYTSSDASNPFPTTIGAYDTSYNGNDDAFVTKMSADGSSLIYSTYLGGGNHDGANGIALDTTGNAYITGWTGSTTPNPFPTTSGAFDTSFNGGPYDAYVTKLSADGSSLIYSTYLGGGGQDQGFAIAVDNTGFAYITGYTNSDEPSPFPTTIGAFDTSYNGNGDAFVTKLSADGSSLIYSTYLGGEETDVGNGITVDSTGNSYITGNTNSDTPNPFPTTTGAYDTTFNGVNDVFATSLSADGSYLNYSTYLGGGGNEVGEGIAIDSSGNAYITGWTNSDTPNPFPTTTGAYDITFNGVYDVFVTKLPMYTTTTTTTTTTTSTTSTTSTTTRPTRGVKLF